MSKGQVSLGVRCHGGRVSGVSCLRGQVSESSKGSHIRGQTSGGQVSGGQMSFNRAEN